MEASTKKIQDNWDKSDSRRLQFSKINSWMRLEHDQTLGNVHCTIGKSVFQGSLTFHTYMTGQNHGKIPMYRGTFLLLGARHIITSLDMSNQQGHSHRGRNHDTTLEVTNKHVPETNVVSKTYGGWEKCLHFFVSFKGVIFKNPLLVFLWAEWKVIFWSLGCGCVAGSLPATVVNERFLGNPYWTCNHPGGHCCCGATPLQLWHVTPKLPQTQKKLFVKRNPAISSSFQ